MSAATPNSPSTEHAPARPAAGGLLAPPARAGWFLLSRLDALGGHVIDRHAARRSSIPASSRIHPATAVVLAGVTAIAGLFAWGAIGAGSGGSQWMTAPGAGNAEAALTSSNGQSAGTKPAPRSAASSTAHHKTLTARHPRGLPVVHESLVILTGGMTGHKGWPEYVGSKQIDLPAHAKVVLTITSFDDGAAPLASALRTYDNVQGTTGGVETYEGKRLSAVANSDVAHTFTVPGIGLNLPVPAAKDAPNGEILPAVVTATFTTHKTGTFTWQCYAPCGSGKNGMSGAMSTPGYMTGKVHIG